MGGGDEKDLHQQGTLTRNGTLSSMTEIQEAISKTQNQKEKCSWTITSPTHTQPQIYTKEESGMRNGRGKENHLKIRKMAQLELRLVSECVRGTGNGRERLIREPRA